MFDAVMVSGEAVLHTPQDSLGPTADSDLPVDRANVRLHGVRAEICQRRDLGVAFALKSTDALWAPPLLLSVTRPLPSEGAEPRAGSHIDVCVDAAWVIPYQNERNKKCLFGDGL